MYADFQATSFCCPGGCGFSGPDPGAHHRKFHDDGGCKDDRQYKRRPNRSWLRDQRAAECCRGGRTEFAGWKYACGRPCCCSRWQRQMEKEEMLRLRTEENKKLLEEQAKRDARAAINCSDEDYNTLLRIVQAEAGVCDEKGKILVANVIINRVKSPRFPPQHHPGSGLPGQPVFAGVQREHQPGASHPGDHRLRGPGPCRGGLLPGSAVFHEPRAVQIRGGGLV